VLDVAAVAAAAAVAVGFEIAAVFRRAVWFRLLSQSYTHHRPHIILHSAAAGALECDTARRCSGRVAPIPRSSHSTTSRRPSRPG